jgi:hypothetical protein
MQDSLERLITLMGSMDQRLSNLERVTNNIMVTQTSLVPASIIEPTRDDYEVHKQMYMIMSFQVLIL